LILFALSAKPDASIGSSDCSFVTQAMDGLGSTAHELPEHIRAIFLKTLHRLMKRIRWGDTALLQPSTAPLQLLEPAAFVPALQSPSWFSPLN
jgi:hypothetical protein